MLCVPVCAQPAFHTPEALQQRAALEHDDMVVEVIQRFWGNFELSAHNEAGHDEYVRVLLLIMRSVMCVPMPPFAAKRTAEPGGARGTFLPVHLVLVVCFLPWSPGSGAAAAA